MVRKRSPVRVWLGAPARPVGEAVNTPAFHAGIQGFESPTGHHIDRRPSLSAGRLGRLAQSGEHLPYKQGVAGSSPAPSTKTLNKGRGGIAKWPNAADCKSAGSAFVGSNPTPSTIDGA